MAHQHNGYGGGYGQPPPPPGPPPHSGNAPPYYTPPGGDYHGAGGLPAMYGAGSPPYGAGGGAGGPLAPPVVPPRPMYNLEQSGPAPGPAYGGHARERDGAFSRGRQDGFDRGQPPRRRSASPPQYGRAQPGMAPPGRYDAQPGPQSGGGFRAGRGGDTRPGRAHGMGPGPAAGGPYDAGRGAPPSDRDDFRPHGRHLRDGGAMSEREHSSLIEKRIQQERPRRTLFVRNVKYGTPASEIKSLFERIGDIKDFADLLDKRGMAFITFYDIRAAMMAKDQLQDYEIGRRPMDVHYSLPRDTDLGKPAQRDQNQGTLSLYVNDARGPLNDQEIYARFGPFGDIKSVGPSPNHPRERFIEFYDSRACERAFDALQGQPMIGGRIDLRFEWDALPPPVEDARPPPDSSARGRGPPSNDRPPMGFNAGPATGQASAYGGSAPSANAAPAAAPLAAGPDLDDRLQQALKAQQLLAALGQAGLAPPPSAVAAAPVAAPGAVPPPPAGVPGIPPPPPGFVPPPPGMVPPPPVAHPGQGSALPPALAALMPSSQQQQQQPSPYGAGSLPPHSTLPHAQSSARSPISPSYAANSPPPYAGGRDGGGGGGGGGGGPSGRGYQQGGPRPPYSPPPRPSSQQSGMQPPPGQYHHQQQQQPPGGASAAPAQVQALLDLLAQQQKQR